jgi:hypothetical protein
MTKTITLKEFLTTGRLGDLENGTDRNEVVRLLGEPPGWAVSRGRKSWQRSLVWIYDLLQIGLDEYVHWLLLEPAFEAIELPYEMQGFYPQRTTTFGEFQKYLNEEGLKYQDVIMFGDRRFLVEGKVSVSFNEDETISEMVTLLGL